MKHAPGTTWPAVPPGVADQIRPLVPDLAEQMVAEISAAVTEYARLGDPVYASNLRLGAETAIAGFADRIAWPHAPRQRLADTFYRIGKVEAAPVSQCITTRAPVRNADCSISRLRPSAASTLPIR